MAFLAAAVPALGTGIGVSTTAGAAASAALGGMGISSAAAAGMVAGTTALPSLATGATAAGFLGTGMSFWQVLGTAANAIGTIGSAIGQVSRGSQEIENTTNTARMVALDDARRQRDLARDRSAAGSRRATSLAVQGGLDVAGGADLVREALTEGSLESVRSASDTSFSGGVLQRRAANVRRGTDFSVLATLASGGARIGSLLA